VLGIGATMLCGSNTCNRFVIVVDVLNTGALIPAGNIEFEYLTLGFGTVGADIPTGFIVL
jgi:hypothetical protein